MYLTGFSITTTNAIHRETSEDLMDRRFLEKKKGKRKKEKEEKQKTKTKKGRKKKEEEKGERKRMEEENIYIQRTG